MAILETVSLCFGRNYCFFNDTSVNCIRHWNGDLLFVVYPLLVIIIRALLVGDPVAGWPSLACIITSLGGVQLLCTGIVGLYLSKAYLETKNRPIFIVKEKN